MFQKKWVRWVVGGAAATMLVLLAVFFWLVRPAHITSMVEDGLRRHLKMDAALERVEVQLLPRPRVSGRGLRISIPNRPDLPPFISIDEFSMDIGLFSLMRKHVTTVYAKGLTIAVPPSDSRDALPRSNGDGEPSEIIVRHLITEDG